MTNYKYPLATDTIDADDFEELAEWIATCYKYPLATDTIDADDFKKLAEWIATCPRVTMGSLTKQYEEKWSQWLGRKYSVFCNSGSSANHLMYYALLMSERLKNNKVIVPSAAWATTISPAIQFGFQPIMCEADAETFGLDIRHLEDLLAEHQPSTVVLVQTLGVPAKMDAIMALKEKYGFILLEDACASMGSSYHGRKIGTFGDMSSVSTYFGHQFSTIEGGLVSTDDKEMYNLLLQLRSHGWVKGLDKESRSALLKKHGIKDTGTDFVFTVPGFNLRPTDLQAFIGIGQLDKMEWLIEKRFNNHLLYKKLLGNKFLTASVDPNSVVCSIHFCVLASYWVERQEIMEALERNGIETRPFTSGNQGLQPYWFERYGKFNRLNATRLYNCGFFLPNNTSLRKDDIEFISEVVIEAAESYRLEGSEYD